MTVPYNSYIHTVTFAGFFNLLLKWNGSVYKLLWRTMLIYAIIYALIAVIYHLCLTRDFKILFERMFDYFNMFQENIPVSFVLGFYVSCIVGRWWEQFNALPHPTRLAIYVTSHIRGTDDRTRLVRRTIMRYACLGYVLTMVTVCGPAKKRFPTYKHMIKAGIHSLISGFMLSSEGKILDNLITHFNKYYVPFVWASTLVAQARKDNMIKDDFAYHCLLDELNFLRRKCQMILNYDWINIPLVYTQVATMAVYIFFVSCLISRQHIPVYTDTGEMIVPLFTFLQFLFYMGWLKVAEELINPFGEDDDDFEINPMIDKNFKVGYMIVDEMHGACPSLVKDQYWDTTDVQMPYTEAALPFYKDPGLLGSANLVEYFFCLVLFLEALFYKVNNFVACLCCSFESLMFGRNE
ncbi:hypothetical protein HELRODRAFT_70757 [Helobdella robusta]|uniref:Bestrophin homolog n=1 Tax=Helobdella robusta TaxID=6412 RepID=T1G0B8_HELRO|nr:hypothetical protein HELRODRAFT_70757 [Helobdella robusta]ESN90644.1 hypothetical protein HELRODRAFT_70757 [Helobdella robusta]